MMEYNLESLVLICLIKILAETPLCNTMILRTIKEKTRMIPSLFTMKAKLPSRTSILFCIPKTRLIDLKPHMLLKCQITEESINRGEVHLDLISTSQRKQLNRWSLAQGLLNITPLRNTLELMLQLELVTGLALLIWIVFQMSPKEALQPTKPLQETPLSKLKKAAKRRSPNRFRKQS